MKLTQKTFNLLKNFSSINQSLYAYTGNKLKTVSETKTVIAEAEVQEMFPREFGIYDLNQFLGIVSLLEEPDLDFDTTYLTISGQNGAKSDYFYADKNTFRIIPSLEPFQLPDTYVSFSITDKVIKGVMQAANVLQLPEIAIVGDGETISIKAVNSKNKTTNTFCYDVGKTDKRFNALFKVENLKMMVGSYEVTLSKQKMAQFKSIDSSLTYTVVNEATSEFE
jgi:hypothetical protein